jgi:hypothetical protein
MARRSSYWRSHVLGFAGTNLLFGGPIGWLWYGTLDPVTALGLIVLGAGMMVLSAARIERSTPPLVSSDPAFAGKKPSRRK